VTDEGDELETMKNIGMVFDAVNAGPDEVVTFQIRVRRKHLDAASEAILKLIVENGW
jgi:hypothetical protein